ncbi:single-stranded DNA-binding protein [bacterium 210820-DFI.6.37]|nr:single-stranded DNA-binding protein [bacterium 210820-DFI.6.37]
MNNVVLIGRLTRDPEVRYTSGTQMAVARFSIAIDRPVRNNGGEKQTDFPNIVVFGKQAENCERFLGKGRLVGVQGRIQTGSYVNKDGVKVYTTEVVANNVEFLDWGDRSERGSSRPAEQTSPKDDMGIPDGFQAIEDEDIPF